MPSYRSGNDEYRRKPRMNYEYEPEMREEEEEEMMDEPKEPKKEPKCPPKKPQCLCKVECPFKIIVKVVPCDEHKECDE